MSSTCTLEEFLKFLKVSCGFYFDMDKHTFGERIKLQKYVYIAIRLGLDPKVPLDYGMYIRGPYSSSLADIYFNIDGWKRPLFDRDKFDVHRYIAIVWLKNTRWLEVACSLIFASQVMGNKAAMGPRDLYDRLKGLKDFSEREVFEAYDYLCEEGLLEGEGERLLPIGN